MTLMVRAMILAGSSHALLISSHNIKKSLISRVGQDSGLGIVIAILVIILVIIIINLTTGFTVVVTKYMMGGIWSGQSSLIVRTFFMKKQKNPLHARRFNLPNGLRHHNSTTSGRCKDH